MRYSSLPHALGKGYPIRPLEPLCRAARVFVMTKEYVAEMNDYAFKWGKLSAGLLVSALAGCGGGGGGYSAPPASTMPAPKASFSQPAQAATIRFGQGLSLTWTSANATACTATVSSASGGTFTGSQSMSGSAMIVPIAPGTYTYTLNCTSTSGNVSASTPTANVLSTLAPSGAIPTIGSAIDPINGDQNPYGLTIAPATAGLITKGDLIVCNFNNGNAGSTPNTQGLGTTIIGLHPTAGSTPYRIAQSVDLQGCNALTMLPSLSRACRPSPKMA